MKKIIGCLAVLTLILNCTGCGDSSSETNSSVAETTEVVTTDATTATTAITTAKTTKATTKVSTTKVIKTTEKKTQPATEAETEPETEPIEEEQVNSGGYFDSSDVYAYYGGYSLTVNQNASTLPEAQSVDVSPSCYYEGDDKVFHYGDIDVYTYPVGEEDYVLEITLLSSGASTARGLTVGMTLDDAIAMYGEGTSGGGIYSWYSGSVYMYVTESGGVITSIGLALQN